MNFFFSMMDYKSAIIRSVLAVVMGVLFCVFPIEMAHYSVMLIGAVIMLGGIIAFMAKRMFQKSEAVQGGGFISLILSIALGMLVILKYEFFAQFIMYCLGAILMIGGGGQLALVFGSRKLIQTSMPVMAYLMPSILVAVGLLICFNPFQTQKVLFVIFGVGSILYGMNDLYTQIRLRKELKKRGKVIRHGDVEDIDYEEIQ